MDVPPYGLRVLLGPGLAAGFAGLGALAEFDRLSISVATVIGVNSGAFAAALWAVETDLTLASRVVAHLPWDDYVIGRDLGRSDPLLATALVLTRDRTFEECRREAQILAIDLENGESVSFDRGSLAWAVRHSMAIPGLFEPIAQDGRRYGDGGLDTHGMQRALEHREDGRSVVFWPRVFLRYGPDLSAAERAAAYAARAWGDGSHGLGRVVEVPGPTCSPLDFGRVFEWIAAGRRAAAAWLGRGHRDAAEGDPV